MTRAARSLAALAVATAAAVLAGCEPVASQTVAPQRQVEQLVSRCVDAMTRDVCVAQRDGAANRSTPPAASQVFVAGAGAMDVQAYNEIRAAGEAMCGLVKTRCSSGWNDGACQTARSLWPAQPKS